MTLEITPKAKMSPVPLRILLYGDYSPNAFCLCEQMNEERVTERSEG